MSARVARRATLAGAALLIALFWTTATTVAGIEGLVLAVFVTGFPIAYGLAVERLAPSGWGRKVAWLAGAWLVFAGLAWTNSAFPGDGSGTPCAGGRFADEFSIYSTRSEPLGLFPPSIRCTGYGSTGQVVQVYPKERDWWVLAALMLPPFAVAGAGRAATTRHTATA